MNTSVLTSWAEVEELAPDWNALLRRSPGDSIFLSWEWVQAWREAAQGRPKPFVIVARDDAGTLRGVAPFYHTNLRFMRLAPYRTLRMLADYQTGFEYPDLIVEPAQEDEVVDRLAEGLRRTRGWDCLWLPRIADWSGASGRWRRFCEKAGLLCRTRPHEFSSLELPADFDTYFAALSQNARSTIRRRAKQLESSGTVELVVCRDPDELQEMLERLFELNDLRWSEAGQRGSFLRKPFEAAFYRAFTPSALRHGWLWLIGLRIDGALRAMQIGFVYNGVFHQMQEGFDPQAPAGIGNVLRSHVFERCIREGLKGYDFLGGFTEHKRRWLAVPRSGIDLFAACPNLRTRVLFSRAIWPTGRYLREKHPTT